MFLAGGFRADFDLQSRMSDAKALLQLGRRLRDCKSVFIGNKQPPA
jgi:hypothetical protein